MQCDCISKMPLQALGQIKVWKNKKILKAEIKETSLRLGPPVQTNTYSHLTLTLENTKRPVDVMLVHAFCPFCGKKIDIEADELKKL